MESLIYPVCLAVGLLFAIISALMGQFFGGHDGTDIGTGGHAEAGFDDAGLPGISLFSPTVLASFVTAFGAFGMIFSRIGPTSSPWVSAPLAIVCGGVIAVAVMALFNQMFKRTQSSSESHVASLVGMEASIITPIPENGVGEIAYVQSSTRYSAPARTETGKSIGAGQAVRITRIVGSQFYVEPLH
jgi:membrane protein implicated in regulation of membrane protease activity